MLRRWYTHTVMGELYVYLFGDSIRGEFHGIRYMLVSGDYLDFHPALVLP